MSKIETHDTDVETRAWDRVLAPWWGKVLVGLLILIGAYIAAGDVANLERGQVDKMNVGRSVRVAYSIGGKGLAVYFPAALGIGFVAWGVVQLVRAAPIFQPPHVRPADGPPDVADGDMSYLHAMYVSFFISILAIVFVLEGALASWLLKTFWGVTQGYVLMVAFLIVLPLAYVQVMAFGRAMGWDDRPFVAWRERSAWFVIGGYALVLAVVVWLATRGFDSQKRDAEQAAAATKVHAERAARTSNPDYQRGIEAMREMNKIKAEERERLGREPTNAEIATIVARRAREAKAATRPR